MRAGRASVAAALGTALALTASACGGSSDSGSAGGSKTVRVGYTSEGGLQIPLYWALEKGLFDDAGITVKPVKVNSSSSLVAAIKSNSTDIGTGDGAAVCSGILSGNDLKVVGANLSTFALEIWGDKSLSDLKQFKGKTFAVTGKGSTSNFALVAALKANGLTTNDVKVAVVNNLPATVAAVQSKAVAATPVVPPHGKPLENEGFKMVYDTSELPHASTVMAVQPAYLKSHKSQITAYLSAMKEAIKQVQLPENKEELAKIVAERATVEESEAAYTVDYFNDLWNQSLEVDQKVWDSTCEEAKVTTKAAGGADPEGALDMSLLAETK